MKLSDIAERYNVPEADLKKFINRYSITYKHKTNLWDGSITLDENFDSDAFIRAFREDEAKLEELKAAKERAEAEKRQAEEQEKAEKNAAMAQMLITSGFSFDGCRITKYSGYISGDDVIEIPRGREGIFATATNVGDALSASLVKIRRQALKELKEAAYDLGCNAVIGVDFDYITLEPETVNAGGGTLYLPYVFCVTANGNAVIIEKE